MIGLSNTGIGNQSLFATLPETADSTIDLVGIVSDFKGYPLTEVEVKLTSTPGIVLNTTDTKRNFVFTRL